MRRFIIVGVPTAYDGEPVFVAIRSSMSIRHRHRHEAAIVGRSTTFPAPRCRSAWCVLADTVDNYAGYDTTTAFHRIQHDARVGGLPGVRLTSRCCPTTLGSQPWAPGEIAHDDPRSACPAYPTVRFPVPG